MQTSDVVGLAGCHKCGSDLRDFRAEGGDRCVLMSVIQDVTMDFIGADDHMMTDTDLANLRKVLLG
jgi:hypothetical protein